MEIIEVINAKDKEITKTIYLTIEFTILPCQVFTNLPAEVV